MKTITNETPTISHAKSPVTLEAAAVGTTEGTEETDGITDGVGSADDEVSGAEDGGAGGDEVGGVVAVGVGGAVVS